MGGTVGSRTGSMMRAMRHIMCGSMPPGPSFSAAAGHLRHNGIWKGPAERRRCRPFPYPFGPVRSPGRRTENEPHRDIPRGFIKEEEKWRNGIMGRISGS